MDGDGRVCGVGGTLEQAHARAVVSALEELGLENLLDAYDYPPADGRLLRAAPARYCRLQGPTRMVEALLGRERPAQVRS
jgi:hypothetical protein